MRESQTEKDRGWVGGERTGEKKYVGSVNGTK